MSNDQKNRVWSASAAGAENAGECATEGYTVGYGKPPQEHRFKKGKSGNPHGRRRKKPLKITIVRRSFAEEVLAEADRVIIVGDGPTAELMTVQQALARQLGEEALKGDKAARKDFIALTLAAYEMRAANALDLFKEADAYKHDWKGRPDAPIHPDDVDIDLRDGTVNVVGPVDDEGRAKVRNMAEERDDIIRRLQNQADVTGMSKMDLHQLAVRILELDEQLPPRLRRDFDLNYLDHLVANALAFAGENKSCRPMGTEPAERQR